jgi:ribosomal subunit interface protein
MQLTITGKQVEVGETLRRHVEASLGTILEKYFKTAIEAHVVLTKEAHLFRSEVSLHIGRGIIVNARASAADVAAAFDAAAERIAKQLRRYKRRLRAHHARARERVGTNRQARSPEPLAFAPEPRLEPAADSGDPGRDPALSSGGRDG